MSIPLEDSGSSSEEDEGQETKYTLPDGTKIEVSVKGV